MVKEYEFFYVVLELISLNVIDIYNLGNVFFNKQFEKIWICYVGCDEVCFNISYFFDLLSEDEVFEDESYLGIDMSKLFYVRVNKVIW